MNLDNGLLETAGIEAVALGFLSNCIKYLAFFATGLKERKSKSNRLELERVDLDCNLKDKRVTHILIDKCH